MTLPAHAPEPPDARNRDHQNLQSTLSANQFEQRLVAARAGSKDALGDLLQAFRPCLLACARKDLSWAVRQKVSPSDLAQDVLRVASRDFHQFQGDTELEWFGWLHGIYRHKLTNTVRAYGPDSKRCTTREVSLNRVVVGRDSEILVPRYDSTPVVEAIRKEEAVLLHEAFERLPPEYQEILELRWVCQWSFAEIGKYLHKSADAARKQCERARERLSAELQKPHDGRTGRITAPESRKSAEPTAPVA